MTSNNAGIIGMGHGYPEGILTNADLEKMVDTNDEWITTRTGIKQRHKAGEHEYTSQFGTAAALQALERAGVDATEIDIIICATTTPDQIMPSTGALIQAQIGATNAAGMDLAWVIPFSRAFSELDPKAFLEGVRKALSPVEVHVGRAFQFGKDRAGNLEALEAWSREAGCRICAHALKAPDGGRLSSTRIRRALDQGDVGEAQVLLGHPYALTGVVVEGERRGRHLGFPTANLAWEQEQLPAYGVYVTEVAGPHFPEPLRGLTNVGEKPTFKGSKVTVETFLPGFQGDLYGAFMEVRFLHRIRGERRFGSLEELKAQIAEDVREGLAWRPEQTEP
jgi:riboflavin kinase/FMN adenylyltransferase